jgi:hypothetical protein
MADENSRRRLKSWRPITLFSREENAKIKLAILKIFAFDIDPLFQTVFPFMEHLNAFRNTNVSESLFELHLEVSEKPKIAWCDIRSIRRTG